MSGQAVTLKNMEQVVFYLKQMAPEEADEKYENVMRQRHMFIYKTEPSNPPSASDIIIDSMCEYALTGYGGTALNEFEDLDVKQERDRKRNVAAAKKAKDRAT
ncbi:hypothetical protein COCSUDRAFT_54203 [Coccomyxa subellipsoidea C-169]|uniref:Uncharacterized protein n=1 Tax=Coccomyxa subellipsoidea (strain C-169) TaxID=574566 RepID=I0YQN9_COCSC|nr:hypothetical protein COCSUDRAFT_54203 [Coccomyxa subellipsoidea C-169]EIE20708.1 hypothetical protein COCSUDRAFT_54203 [Coccomyxa subellipsoidea C-169]|eukprot:XP_005645252.1 hypothetical protein COCSUDRAFT_54203 [Coccomyxa subellipsoidea C-169]